MVVCHSDSNLVKGESSSDNGESDCDTVCMEKNDEMASKSFYHNNMTLDENPVAGTNFGNVSVCNSSDVHFGNKTYYNGPVTIKQFVYSPEDCALSPGKRLGVPQVFRKLSFTEGPESANENSSSTGATGDLKTTNEVQDCSSFTSPESTTSKKFFEKYIPCSALHHHCLVGASLIFCAVLLFISTVVFLKYWKKEENSRAIPQSVVPHETILGLPSEFNFTLSGKLRIMERKEWLAQPVSAPLENLSTPVPYVIISHTATEECVKIAECVFIVRTVQTFHLESKSWWDIGYNFLVGGDGFAYTGRGWDKVGAHAYGYNNLSIGISFIGTFNSVLPPERQLTAAKQLIELGVKLGKISENYKLLAHRQVSATESPGAVLYQELQTWPHWAPNP